MRMIGPAPLLLMCWGVSLAITGLALALPGYFDLVALFLHRDMLDLRAFGSAGAVWIGTALLVYLVADLAARHSLPRRRPFRPGVPLHRLAGLTFGLNLLLLSVTLGWIALTAARTGGLAPLLNLAYADSLTARDLLIEHKLFTGMRLFYAALPATGCLAAACLASGALGRGARRACLGVLALNAIALTLLPLVMSQRLLLLQFLASSYLAACLVRGRLFGLAWLALALLLFLLTWVLRESLTNPAINRSALDLGSQKLAYYFVNDMRNGFAPLQAEIAHTFGAISLRGLMFLSFSEEFFSDLLAPRLAALAALRGGGELPLFTAVYVDFGLLPGTLVIALCGFGFRLLFHKAKQSLGWATLYAQLGAALLFSSHGIYFTHQNFLFSLLLIVLTLRCARGRPGSRPGSRVIAGGAA
ncbi:hypothetical protein ACFSUD_08550 [Sulfitobacter aestuarii]|uniref:Oligosaccharide repeat unit polymerase n=1 Tax=Sulfitobacter aestuarii TaxID=2161676 RepID=A0ABW5U1G4_9RHOB